MTRRLGTRTRLVTCLFALACLLAPTPARAASISVTAGGLFGYIPLDAFGTPPTVLATDGGQSQTTPGFVFAGETWTSITAAENGFLAIGSSVDVSSTGQTLPSLAGPNNVLAPFWADLTNVSFYITVLTDGVSNWIVAEWRGNLAGGAAFSPFQVWIGANGSEDITFTYRDINSPRPAGVIVGAEDKTGLFGDQYIGSTLQDLRVTSEGLPDPVPEPGTMTLLLTGFAVAGRSLKRRLR